MGHIRKVILFAFLPAPWQLRNLRQFLLYLLFPLMHLGPQPALVYKEQAADPNQRQYIIDYAVCLQSADNVGLGHCVGQRHQ